MSNQIAFIISNSITSETSGLFVESSVEQAKKLFIKMINGGNINMTEQRSNFHLNEMGTYNCQDGYVFSKPKLVCSGANTPMN